MGCNWNCESVIPLIAGCLFCNQRGKGFNAYAMVGHNHDQGVAIRLRHSSCQNSVHVPVHAFDCTQGFIVSGIGFVHRPHEHMLPLISVREIVEPQARLEPLQFVLEQLQTFLQDTLVLREELPLIQHAVVKRLYEFKALEAISFVFFEVFEVFVVQV